MAWAPPARRPNSLLPFCSLVRASSSSSSQWCAPARNGPLDPAGIVNRLPERAHWNARHAWPRIRPRTRDHPSSAHVQKASGQCKRRAPNAMESIRSSGPAILVRTLITLAMPMRHGDRPSRVHRVPGRGIRHQEFAIDPELGEHRQRNPPTEWLPIPANCTTHRPWLSRVGGPHRNRSREWNGRGKNRKSRVAG